MSLEFLAAFELLLRDILKREMQLLLRELVEKPGNSFSSPVITINALTVKGGPLHSR